MGLQSLHAAAVAIDPCANMSRSRSPNVRSHHKCHKDTATYSFHVFFFAAVFCSLFVYGYIYSAVCYSLTCFIICYWGRKLLFLLASFHFRSVWLFKRAIVIVQTMVQLEADKWYYSCHWQYNMKSFKRIDWWQEVIGLLPHHVVVESANNHECHSGLAALGVRT